MLNVRLWNLLWCCVHDNMLTSAFPSNDAGFLKRSTEILKKDHASKQRDWYMNFKEWGRTIGCAGCAAIQYADFDEEECLRRGPAPEL